MSTLQLSSSADLESATDCNNGGAGSGGGGGEHESAEAIVIIGVAENNNGEDKIEERRQPNVSVEIADLEAGAPERKVHLGKSEIERDCRICHLSMDGANQDSGFPIELGCSCKDDLAAAHKQCAEAWFKIKGDKTCEICGSVAQNVAGAVEAEPAESWNEMNEAAAAAPSSQSRNFWQGHRFLNFLLACMVFAFVISWLFHFNVPS